MKQLRRFILTINNPLAGTTAIAIGKYYPMALRNTERAMLYRDITYIATTSHRRGE
jgi:hypothetical protein